MMNQKWGIYLVADDIRSILEWKTYEMTTSVKSSWILTHETKQYLAAFCSSHEMHVNDWDIQKAVPWRWRSALCANPPFTHSVILNGRN